MALKDRSTLYTFILFLLLFPTFLASRNFIVVLYDLKCIANNGYVKNISCIVDRSSGQPRITLYMQMQKDIKMPMFDLEVYFEKSKPKKESVPLLKADGVKYCELYNAETAFPVLKTFKDVIKRSGTIPDCPIPPDFRYIFPNLTVDPEYLPSYMAEVSFKVIWIMYDKKTPFLTSTTLGKIVHKKKKNKVPRNF